MSWLMSHVAEDVRGTGLASWFHDATIMMTLSDFKQAFRALSRTPWFSVTVVLLLGIAIGANVLIYSVIDHLLLEPLPFPESDQLVQVWAKDARRGDRGPLSLHDVVDLGRESDAFQGVAGYGYQNLTILEDGGMSRISGLSTTPAFFDVLKYEMVEGRGLREGDDESVVVISTGFRDRVFGGARNVAGESILLSGRNVNVVGVTRDRGAFGSIDVWVPLEMDLSEAKRGNHYLFGVARLKAGRTLSSASAEVDALARRLAVEYGESNPDDVGFRLVSLRDEWFGQLRVPLYVLFATVAIILLIVCANVAGLMLARATSRRREVAIRAALGAGKRHLVRQFMTEGTLLAIASGTAGTLLAAWSVSSARRFAPRAVVEGLGVDGSVLAFALAATAVVALVFSLVPILHASRVDLMETLRLAGAGDESHARTTGRRVFVVVQIAMTVVLMVSGVLFTRSLRDLWSVNPGFDPSGTLTMRVALADSRFDDPAEVNSVQRRMIDEIAAIGSVESVGVVSDLPFSGSRTSSSFRIVGHEDYLTADRRQASDGYFEAMGIPVIEGRGLTVSDDLSNPRVAVVNEKMAKALWPGESALGRKIVIGSPEEIELEGHEVEREIVGVVGSIVHDRLGTEPAMEMYVSSAQLPSRRMFVAIRSNEGTATLIREVREAVRRADPTVAVHGFESMNDRLSRSLRRNEIVAWGVGSFSLFALLLSVVGLYGLVSFMVAQRVREFGVRRALGASPASIVRRVIREGAVLAAIGLVLGSAAALFLGRFLRSLLYRVSPHDPITFAFVALFLGFVAVAACAVPAARAASVEVMNALREN